MNAKQAIEAVMKKYPGRIPYGYWKTADGIVVNARPPKASRDIAAPALFIVKQNGDIFGITPMDYDLPFDKMIKV